MFKDDDASGVEAQTILNGCAIAMREPLFQPGFWVFIANHFNTIWNKRQGRPRRANARILVAGWQSARHKYPAV
jgi:hypothetical protein